MQGSAAGDAGNPTKAVRDEDAFDVPAVCAWLRSTAPAEYADTVARDPEVTQFAGGASNLTYLLRYPDRDLILRRPPAGQKARGAHDMAREARIQAALAPVFPLVPRIVGLCQDESVLGSDFYVMERIDGTIPRKEFPAELELTEAQVEQICHNALDVLISLHRIDPAEAGLTEFGKGYGYVERQVSGWATRFRAARTEGGPDFEKVIAWLEENQPEDVGNCLIHNDFRFDNLILDQADPSRIVGVLDWEMATLGDPLMDLGGTLAYWVQADDDEFFRMFRRQPSTTPGMWTRNQVLAYYCEQMGFTLTPEQWRFYEVFGLFRLAVIVQQIYYRYFHGQTTNPAYAVFGDAATYLEQRCLQVIS